MKTFVVISGLLITENVIQILGNRKDDKNRTIQAKNHGHDKHTSAMLFTIIYFPAKDAVAMVSSWAYLP